MKLNSDDPRITAYLLGELDDADRVAFERELTGCEASRQYLREMREAHDLLAFNLQEPPSGSLTDERRQRVLAGKPVKPNGKRVLPFILLAAAACLAVAGVVFLGPWQQRETNNYAMDTDAPAPAATAQKADRGQAVEEQALADAASMEVTEEMVAQVPPPATLPGPPAAAQAERKAAPEMGRRAPEAAATAAPETEKQISGVYALRPSAPAPALAFSAQADVGMRWPAPPPGDAAGAEEYRGLPANEMKLAAEEPLSTFSIDVDTASYANVRRFLNQRQLPPADAVRIEEMINYFDYAYPQPEGEAPFSVTLEAAQCPWAMEHRLVRIGLKGKEIAARERPATNLVFLLDVSGSMRAANKLPLVKHAIKLLAEQLDERDRVTIVVYAGAAGVVLPPTRGDNWQAISEAINNLQAGGSTNGGQGIQLAYKLAREAFREDGVNRVMLATDGDFNVGTTNTDALVQLIADEAKHGIFLTVLGFGMGNLKDGRLEAIADKGNGAYAYIDDEREAEKVMVEQFTGTLVTIAKDVKIQVEFNPTKVKAYRLVGYENRLLANRDFADDTKDAGEIGAGHTVTALYEIVPVEPAPALAAADTAVAGMAAAADGAGAAMRYQARDLTAGRASLELLHVKLRYKEPRADTSQLLQVPLVDQGKRYSEASADFKFAAAVAAFGMILRQDAERGTATLDGVLELAGEGVANDAHGYRQQFLELVRVAKALVK